MQYIDYKNNHLSKLALGTVQFGLDYGIANKDGKVSFDEAEKIIKFLLEKGINTFDTAMEYGDSEKVLGKILKNRNDYIFSKIKSDKVSENAVKISLNNLKKEKIFAYLFHDVQILKDFDLQKIKLLKKYAKFTGISIYEDNEFNMAIENEHIDIIQIPFNIFDLRAITNNWIEKAKEKNKLLVIRSIFLQGLFFLDYNKLPLYLKEAKEYLKKLNNLCNELNIPKANLALNFPNQIANESIILFGCDNLNQAKDNIKLFENEIKITQEIKEEILKHFKNMPKKIYNPTGWNR